MGYESLLLLFRKIFENFKNIVNKKSTMETIEQSVKSLWS